MKTEKRPLGLYIHIPFCVRKCRYCDFLSAPGSRQQIEAYLQGVKRQIRLYGTLLCEQGTAAGFEYVVDSIFIGGGTPSILTKEQMQQLLHTVKTYFSVTPEAEITAECNPKTADKEQLRGYRQAGINRLSIGLQSADDKELALLGRIHTWEDFLNTYSAARAAGFFNINVDLMSALPGQNREHLRKTLEQVIALKPEHISAYSLIVEEGTPFYELYGSGEGLPEEEEVAAMDQLILELLTRSGYERYEISNYAERGKECMHNLKYWRCEEYLGLGSGAASYMRADCGLVQVEASYVRLKNPTDTGKMIQCSWTEPVFEEILQLSTREQMEEMAFLGLRTTKGVDLTTFEARFGVSFRKVFQAPVSRYQELGLLQIGDAYASLSQHGLEVSNVIMADFVEE